ncbi:cytochrome P450 [Mycolicibacterium novocastrense]|uniref:Cytochrome P450 n=1 Tax=Mycolicibacterium novocastrense TaxID=59813 RepID=A0ABQ0KR78_MYCNV|nr:cytochrome P450 [Mycolicibacterium novocastrense]
MEGGTQMTVSADEGVRDSRDSAVKKGDVHYDPHLNRDADPMFARIRVHAPLYYSAEHHFHALSRYADVDAALLFSSARGAVLESIKAGRGNALAGLEGRIALDEILQRFPDWHVDLTDAELSPTSTVRGWDSMPAVVV